MNRITLSLFLVYLPLVSFAGVHDIPDNIAVPTDSPWALGSLALVIVLIVNRLRK